LNQKKDTNSRKWQITINNPVEKGYNHDKIKEILSNFKSLVYWCMSDEVGEKETYHTHLYIAFSSCVRFSTIKNNFEGSHYEMANGTSQQNRDYVFKEGKWEKDKKRETNLKDTHEEHGEMPLERQGARNDLNDLRDMIEQGMTTLEIVQEDARYIMRMGEIERYRQLFKENMYRKVFRSMQVTYVYGETGTGKTRNAMEKHGYEAVYRVTDYDHPWDAYKGQDIVLFEEFRSSLKIQDMLNYLDGYPLELPCRYQNKTACFTNIYIVTNLRLHQQYESIQKEHPETWKAFLRRIKKVEEYTSHGVNSTSIEKYLDRTIDAFFEGIELM